MRFKMVTAMRTNLVVRLIENGGMRRGVVLTAVGSLIAAAGGCYIGWHGSTAEPKRPAAVCPVVRPELLDRLVPNHTQYDEPFGGEGYAGMACVVR
jgi:hypothetical protein